MTEKNSFFKTITQSNKFLENYPLWIAILLNSFLFGLILVFAHIAYMTNDDVMFMALLSGKIGGIANSPYLLDINIIVSSFLMKLYEWFPSGFWYESFLVLGLWLAHTTIFYVGLKKYPTIISCCLYVFFFFTLSVMSLLKLQFTIVAALLAISGIALIVFLDKKVTKKVFGTAMIGGLMIVLASLLSLDTVKMVCVLFLPILFFKCLEHRFNRAVLFKFIPIGIALFVAYILGIGNVYHCNQNPECAEFKKFNNLRTQLLDDKQLEHVSLSQKYKALTKVRWSENDYKLLMSWFFMDENLYNVATFEKALTDVPMIKENIKSDRVLYFFKLVFSSPFGIGAMFFIALNMFFLPIFKNKKNVLITIISLVTITSLMLYLIYFDKLPPDTVIGPVFVFAALIPYWLLSKYNSLELAKLSILRKITLSFLLLIAGVLLLKSITSIVQTSNQKKAQLVWLKKTVKELKFDKNALFIDWGGAFPASFIGVFESNNYLKDLKLFSLGWAQRNQANQEILRKMGVNNIYTDLVDKNNLYLLLRKKDWNKFPMYRDYLKQHYKKDAKGDILVSNEIFNVYQVNLK